MELAMPIHIINKMHRDDSFACKICTYQKFFVPLHRVLKRTPCWVVATTKQGCLTTNLGIVSKVYVY